MFMCCSLDQALHSAGISTGFIIFGTNLTNPLNELLLALQPVKKTLFIILFMRIYSHLVLLLDLNTNLFTHSKSFKHVLQFLC